MRTEVLNTNFHTRVCIKMLTGDTRVYEIKALTEDAQTGPQLKVSYSRVYIFLTEEAYWFSILFPKHSLKLSF